MKGEGYKTRTNDEKTIFHFNSVGVKGTIPKIVEYYPLGNNIWNLAFGDETGDDFDDAVISNNNDLRKVIQTVVNTIYDFTEKHPKCMVHIEPVDEKRKLLYNSIFKRKQKEVEANFSIFGFIGKKGEAYNREKDYERFVIVSKKD